MSKIISGINFDVVADFRTNVKFRLGDDEKSLPLIRLCDADRGELFLKRYATLEAEWTMIVNAHSARAGACKIALDELNTNPENTKPDTDKLIEAVAQAQRAIEDAQKEQDILMKRIRALKLEVLDFIAPYLEGTGVCERLKELPDKTTHLVLIAMIHGESAFQETDDSKKNSQG